MSGRIRLPRQSRRMLPTAGAIQTCRSRAMLPYVRGRDGHCWPPPAQIRTSGIPASGSYLECLTAKRALGQG